MKKSFLLVGGIVAAVIFIAILIFQFNGSGQVTSSGGSGTGSASEKVITIDASRFQYSQSQITVNQGDHVKIIINSVDTPHGIAIPDYGVSGVESVEFVADKAGTFEFRCPTPCGAGHRTMTGTLVVNAA